MFRVPLPKPLLALSAALALTGAARAAPTRAQLDCYRVCNQTVPQEQKRNACLRSCTAGKGPAGAPSAGRSAAVTPGSSAPKPGTTPAAAAAIKRRGALDSPMGRASQERAAADDERADRAARRAKCLGDKDKKAYPDVWHSTCEDDRQLDSFYPPSVPVAPKGKARR